MHPRFAKLDPFPLNKRKKKPRTLTIPLVFEDKYAYSKAPWKREYIEWMVRYWLEAVPSQAVKGEM